MPTTPSLSRRHALRLVAATPVALAAGLALAPMPAAAKTKQQAIGYQPMPKKGRKCAGCRHFQAPNACRLVEGEISPDGWCRIWAKAKS